MFLLFNEIIQRLYIEIYLNFFHNCIKSKEEIIITKGLFYLENNWFKVAGSEAMLEDGSAIII